ncbi:MAG: sigma 54-interacting transcriptional regulator [Planctomycetota bacterium]
MELSNQTRRNDERKLLVITGDVAVAQHGDAVRALAHSLHDSSLRHREPWAEHDCADPTCLHESRTFVGEYMEVFPGHYHRYLGLFEQARGGTLLLRRVECLGSAAQRTLASVLEQRFFSPIRSSEPRTYEATTILTLGEGEAVGDHTVDPALQRVLATAEAVVQEDANA